MRTHEELVKKYSRIAQSKETSAYYDFDGSLLISFPSKVDVPNQLDVNEIDPSRLEFLTRSTGYDFGAEINRLNPGLSDRAQDYFSRNDGDLKKLVADAYGHIIATEEARDAHNLFK